MAGLRWQTPPSSAWPAGADAYVKAVRAGVHGVCQRYQVEVEAHMKSTASWVDRTGAARQTLYAAVEPPTPAQVMDVIEFIMAHGVIHGYWLEGINYLKGFSPTMQGQKYAIIQPTLDTYAPKIWADVRKLFR